MSPAVAIAIVVLVVLLGLLLLRGSADQTRALPDVHEGEARAFARSLKERIDEIADTYIRPDEGTYDDGAAPEEPGRVREGSG